jgi:hypothetical protein
MSRYAFVSESLTGQWQSLHGRTNFGTLVWTNTVKFPHQKKSPETFVSGLMNRQKQDSNLVLAFLPGHFLSLKALGTLNHGEFNRLPFL